MWINSRHAYVGEAKYYMRKKNRQYNEMLRATIIHLKIVCGRRRWRLWFFFCHNEQNRTFCWRASRCLAVLLKVYYVNRIFDPLWSVLYIPVRCFPAARPSTINIKRLSCPNPRLIRLLRPLFGTAFSFPVFCLAVLNLLFSRPGLFSTVFVAFQKRP